MPHIDIETLIHDFAEYCAFIVNHNVNVEIGTLSSPPKEIFTTNLSKYLSNDLHQIFGRCIIPFTEKTFDTKVFKVAAF